MIMVIFNFQYHKSIIKNFKHRLNFVESAAALNEC